MATEERGQTRGDFGEVSRIRGIAFRYLSFGASVIGILALAVLLVYVFVDAFELGKASPEWLLTYFVTLVIPLIAFCLYSADDRAVTRRTVAVLGSGLVLTAVLFEVIEAFLGPIPRLNWQLAYLFAIVVPMTGYAIYAGSREPTAGVGFGVIGRAAGGTAVGLSIGILFLVLDERLWFLVFTLAVVPATALYAFLRATADDDTGVARYARAYPTLSVALVGVGGLLAAVVLRGVVRTYPTLPLIYLWTIAVPIAVSTAGLVATRGGGKFEMAAVGAVPLVAGVVGVPVGAFGLPAGSAVPLFAAATAPLATYIHRVIDTGSGRLGLALPLLLAAGIICGTLIVESFGFAGPNAWLDYGFLTQAASRTAEDAGFYPAIVGSVIVISLVAVLSLVLGVATAVFLEEYASSSGTIGTITRIIQINISNLAAVPSVVYGLLGLGLFANLFGLGFGTAITAALTLSLLILPITIVSAQEAIRAVPDEMRRGSDAMGATRWQTTKNIVLPQALPGIFTGVILSLGRAIGETAPLIMIGAANYVTDAPNSLSSTVSAMPMQIYVWSTSAIGEFRTTVLAAGVVTLLIVLLSMNATAIILRNRTESDL